MLMKQIIHIYTRIEIKYVVLKLNLEPTYSFNSLQQPRGNHSALASSAMSMQQVSTNNVARLRKEVAKAIAVASNYARNPQQRHFGVKVKSKNR